MDEKEEVSNNNIGLVVGGEGCDFIVIDRMLVLGFLYSLIKLSFLVCSVILVGV